MATKNIVPRADNEGGIGRADKRWHSGSFVSGSFESIESTHFSGSGINITGIITSSYSISSSYAITSSYAVSASHEIIKEVSSSYADTASFAQSGNGIFSGSFSGSYQGDGSQLTGIVSSSYALTASYVETSQTASYVISSSIDGITNYVRVDQTSSMSVATASYVENAQTASYVETSQTASYVEASNIVQPFTNITASGNISSSGLITGETLEVMGTADFNGSTTFESGTTFNQGAAFDEGEFTMGTHGRFSYGDWVQSVAETSIDCRYKNIIELVPARVPAPWTVTSIHHVMEGQPLILLFDDFGTGVAVTIQDNATMNLSGSTDFIMNAGDTLSLIASSTTDTWYETSRMVR